MSLQVDDFHYMNSCCVWLHTCDINCTAIMLRVSASAILVPLNGQYRNERLW